MHSSGAPCPSSETILPAVFRAFLRSFDGYVLPETNTVTADRAAAEAAFTELVNRAYLDGQNWAAVLSCNDSQIAFHCFDRRPGDADYWRDKLADIRWPSGRVGRPRLMEGGRRINIYLDSVSLETADKLGGGNVSEGIRLALAALRPGKKQAEGVSGKDCRKLDE